VGPGKAHGPTDLPRAHHPGRNRHGPPQPRPVRTPVRSVPDEGGSDGA
jgi:hypothetical protein